MRKLISFCLFFFCIAGLQAAINIKRIDPAFWWCGMKNKELQIMVYGDKIGDAKASLKYPGVTLEKNRTPRQSQLPVFISEYIG